METIIDQRGVYMTENEEQEEKEAGEEEFKEEEVEEPFEEEGFEPVEEAEKEEEIEAEPVEEEPATKEAKKAVEPEITLDKSLEEVAEIGAMSGRLVDFLIIIIAVVMVLFFVFNGLWQDLDKMYALEMGVLLNIGLVGLVVIVLLYVAASSNISKGDALCRFNQRFVES